MEEPSALTTKRLEPASRGIPSKESLWFAYSKLPMSTEARWEPDDILKLVFPPQYKRSQYDIALKLLKHLSEREQLTGDELAAWQAQQHIPNSTLRNLVIPRLIAVGLIARERRNPTGQTEKDKRHHMVLKTSKRFGEAFKHIGEQWNAMVETWRVKRKQSIEPMQ
ncbi:hypothetical protein KJ765_02800 [Candidatus Micrarchaeota archaeon]|nr:hypothetical protein [Candidatus Micrarchaeota archaeon]